MFSFSRDSIISGPRASLFIFFRLPLGRHRIGYLDFRLDCALGSGLQSLGGRLKRACKT